eukprot:COSAG04_NODE_4389_length_2124_cov_5.966914_4_plen_146_part_01
MSSAKPVTTPAKIISLLCAGFVTLLARCSMLNLCGFSRSKTPPPANKGFAVCSRQSSELDHTTSSAPLNSVRLGRSSGSSDQHFSTNSIRPSGLAAPRKSLRSGRRSSRGLFFSQPARCCSSVANSRISSLTSNAFRAISMISSCL